MLLLGDDGWVVHRDNGIKYSYDVTRCMFSAGNISEKLRVAQLSCVGETVVDLYAGIGYFTLPYLVHAGAHAVHACEWNPHALEALARNLELNGVADRCTIHPGDNTIVGPPLGVADRVNLGLIPSSEPGWAVAVNALKHDSGGWLHLHENVDCTTPSDQAAPRKRWEARGLEIAGVLSALAQASHGRQWAITVAHIEKVKSYAPHVYHLVFDLQCRPCPPKADPNL